jgi:Family of unknown function (DUF6084)
MPGLTFAVDNAEAIPFAASPIIAFHLRVANSLADVAIQSIALRCQIQIEAQRRHYTPAERQGLRDLFGEADRWSQTLRPLLWTHAGITVPEFSGTIAVELPVACTFDFNVAAAKYFHAIEEEDVPLVFQFSGTIFFAAEDGRMQITQIGWDKESRFRLPARVWREMMDFYYPNSNWLRLSRDVFDRLHDYKQSNGMATWDQAIESLLPAVKKAAS